MNASTRAWTEARGRQSVIEDGRRRVFASVVLVLAALWGGALWMAPKSPAASTRNAEIAAPLEDALILSATPETERLARALGESFVTEHPRVRLRFSTRPTSETCFGDLVDRRVQLIIVPRVLTSAEATEFAVGGYCLTQFPLRLDPYHVSMQQRRPRFFALYGCEEVVRGRPALRAFITFAQCQSAVTAAGSREAGPVRL